MFESFGPIGFSSLPITSFFPAPTVAAPVTSYITPVSTGQTGGKDMDWGSLFGGAAGGAATGAVAGGPIGAGIGGVLGGLGSLFSPSKTGTSSGMPGLSDALTLGLGSLFGGGKSAATPMVITQTQNVNQATQVDVQNVLGREFGGGLASDGTFDVFKTLGDVFTIRDAMQAGTGETVSGGTPVSFQTAPAKSNLMTYLLIGGALVGGYLLLRKGK
jgi:hypothetical protein